MNHRNHCSILLVCALLLTTLTACGGGTSDGSASASTAPAVTSAWEMDKDNHWHLTQDGDPTDLAPHTLDGGTCSVCGAEISTFEGGETWVMAYNDHNELCVWITYGSDGNMIQNEKYVYTYDKDGNWLTELEYHDGELAIESTFTTVATEEENYTYADHRTTYYEDGAKLVEIYQDDSEDRTEILYQADGTVAHQYNVVNEYNENDLISDTKKYDGDAIAEEVQYEYDADGNSLLTRTYQNGTLVKEEHFTNNDGHVYVSKEVAYDADGKQTVIEYDENGDAVTTH